MTNLLSLASNSQVFNWRRKRRSKLRFLKLRLKFQHRATVWCHGFQCSWRKLLYNEFSNTCWLCGSLEHIAIHFCWSLKDYVNAGRSHQIVTSWWVGVVGETRRSHLYFIFAWFLTLQASSCCNSGAVGTVNGRFRIARSNFALQRLCSGLKRQFYATVVRDFLFICLFLTRKMCNELNNKKKKKPLACHG